MTKVKESLNKSELIFAEHPKNPLFNDLSNLTFHDWKVLGYAGKVNDRSMWFCECSPCGKVKKVSGTSLSTGSTKGCGCRNKKFSFKYPMLVKPNVNLKKEDVRPIDIPKADYFIDLTGTKNERLKVLGFAGYFKRKKSYWFVVCDCGVYKAIRADHIKAKKVASCGCLTKDVNRKAKLKHGDNPKDRNGRSRIYNIWANMKSRCSNKNHNAYKYYGEKGVNVCKEWQEYVPFKKWALKNGYKDNLTIDRINVDGNYCPENCRWVTMKVQGNNKISNNEIMYNDEKKNVTQWAKELDIKRKTLSGRLESGWSVKKAIETPVKKINNKYQYKGQIKSSTEWVEKLDIGKTTFYRMVERGEVKKL